MAKHHTENTVPSFSLEAHIQRVRTIVEDMQKGVGDFDRQIELFKEGIQLIKESNAYLNHVELEIKQWTEGELKDLK